MAVQQRNRTFIRYGGLLLAVGAGASLIAFGTFVMITMPNIPGPIRVILNIIAAIDLILLSFFNETDLKQAVIFLFLREGRKPRNMPLKLWFKFYMFVMVGVVCATLANIPSDDPYPLQPSPLSGATTVTPVTSFPESGAGNNLLSRPLRNSPTPSAQNSTQDAVSTATSTATSLAVSPSAAARTDLPKTAVAESTSISPTFMVVATNRPESAPNTQTSDLLSSIVTSAETPTPMLIQPMNTAMPAPVATPVPTDISILPIRTTTPTDVPTFTPTPTDVPTFTPTPTDVPTFTPTPTDVPTFTPTPTDMPTFTPTPTCLPEQIRPLDIALVLDRSGSMDGDRLVDAQLAAISFLDLLSVEDQVSIISFASDARLDQPLTYNREDARRAIARLSAGGNTQINSGIRTATDELTGERHNPDAQQVLILLTDAETKGGDEGAIAEATIAKSKNIRIITIGLNQSGQEQIDLLRKIASADTDMYLSPSSEDLGAIYATISTVIRSCNNMPAPAATIDIPTMPPVPSALPAQITPPTALLISTETPIVVGPQSWSNVS